MENPELSPLKQYQTIDTMYKYSNGKNIPWGTH